jgi:FOG: CBS domain
MKLYEISQLPVLDGAKVVGIIDESDLLLAVYGRPEHFREPVSSAMNDRLEVIEVDGRSPICCRSSRRTTSPWSSRAANSSGSSPASIC